MLFSCRKATLINIQEYNIPLLKKDSRFKHDLLVFTKKTDFEFYYKQIESNPTNKNLLPANFKSLHKALDDFRSNSKITSARTTNVSVDTSEYFYDMKNYAIKTEAESDLLNEDMQVIIEDTLYQLTRIGIFKVADKEIQTFLNLYDSNEDNILFNPSDTSLANEIPLPDGTYQVEPGIYRLPAPIDILNDPTDFGGGGYIPPCSITLPTNFQYATYSVGSVFNREEAINFDDRRFVFETFNTNFLGFIHSVGIKGKLQRERRFLWFTYWGESYADEIIVGCDNMDLHTSYIFPTPQQFNTLASPQFTGVFNLTIGNHVLDAVGINININGPFGSNISNSQVSNFINGQFNSLLNNTFNDNFTPFVNNLIANFDPSYPSRYANYAKRVNSLIDQNRYRISLSNGIKAQGYSHFNTWRFDWNIGAEIFPGPNTSNPTYTYDMKTGSFYGRARVGCKWYGIRIVRL